MAAWYFSFYCPVETSLWSCRTSLGAEVANGNGSSTDPSGFTQKEILLEFILPELKEINAKLDTKAEVADVQKLETRVENLSKAAAALPSTIAKVSELEKKLTSPEQVAQMINDGLQANKARGWTNRERLLGAGVGLMTLLTLVLNLVANHG